MAKSYSYSRLNTYIQCPRKHYYNYIEKIETPDSPNTLPGSLFHKCCEIYLKHEEGWEEQIKECFFEFDTLANKGIIKKDAGLLKYVFDKYIDYYKTAFDEETSLLVEYKFTEQLNDDDPPDCFTGIIDEVYQHKGLTIVRDRKTALRELKYNNDNVKYNQQLLLYAPFVEEKLGVKVDAIEIDEVLFEKTVPVPYLKNGKPAKDRDVLKYVEYKDYYKALKELCLEDEEEYKKVKEWFVKRGHPLFRRTRAQLLDDSIVNSNAQDILDMYKCIRGNENNKFRCRSILCNYCEFKELCNLDMYNPDDDIRNTLIDKLKKGL